MNQKKHEAADRKRIDHEKANEKLKEHTSNHINNIVEVKFQKKIKMIVRLIENRLRSILIRKIRL